MSHAHASQWTVILRDHLGVARGSECGASETRDVVTDCPGQPQPSSVTVNDEARDPKHPGPSRT